MSVHFDFLMMLKSLFENHYFLENANLPDKRKSKNGTFFCEIQINNSNRQQHQQSHAQSRGSGKRGLQL